MLAARVSPPAEPRPRAASETRVRVQIPGGGCCSLSLSQRPRIFPIAPAYNIASSRHRYFIIPRVPRPETPSSPQRDLHRANLVHSYFALTSPFPILPIFSFKNENEENWRKLPRRRCLRERKTNELFDFFVVTVETR